MRVSLFFLAFCSFLGLASECSAENTYRVYLVTEKINDQIVIGIAEEYQKSLNEYPVNGGYLYDFGVFLIPDIEDIDLSVRIYSQEQRRVRRATQYSDNQACNISTCQGFKFEKVESAATSTKNPDDLCRLHVTSCGRGAIIR